MTTANDSLWYVEQPSGAYTNYIGNMTTSGTTTDYHISSSSVNDLDIASITTGPDGNVWFDGCNGESGYSGFLNVSTGAVTFYSNPLSLTCSDGAIMGPITTGPDGNIWYSVLGYTTHEENTYIFSVNPSTGSTTTASETSSLESITAMTSGSDGRLWLTDSYNNEVDALTISSGHVTAQSQYTVPTSNSQPRGIISGPDGNLWFLETDGDITKVTTSGSFTEYSPPSGVEPVALAAGSDGAVWFTGSVTGGAKIGRITSSGSTTDYTAPGSGLSLGTGITSGPDGAIWFDYEGGGTYSLGRVGY